MLTGDKLETAENIGYACRLIQEDFQKLYIMETDNLKELYPKLLKTIEKLTRIGKRKALLVEGRAIGTISLTIFRKDAP